MTTDYIEDWSTRPSDQQTQQFAQDLLAVNLNQPHPPLPFWNVRSGEIHWGYIGTTFGVLLLKPGEEYYQIISQYQKDPKTYKNTPKSIINYAINHRLSALANLYDPQFQVGFEKLASQYYHEVFIDKEIPEELFVEMFKVMELKDQPDVLDEMYRLTLDLARKRLLKDLDSNTLHLNEMEACTHLYRQTGELPHIGVYKTADWINYLVKYEHVEEAVQIINQMDDNFFFKVSLSLKQNALEVIYDAMRGGLRVDSREKHRSMRDQLRYLKQQ